MKRTAIETTPVIDTTPAGVRKAWSAVPLMFVPICNGCKQDTSLHENTC